MLKEPYRDYATNAFVRFANLGCPTAEEYKERVKKDVYNRLALHPPDFIVIKANAAVSTQKPVLEDIAAINKMFEWLDENNKDYVSDAVRAIYFVSPDHLPGRNEIVDRVHAYMFSAHLSERTVYYYLKHARQLFAYLRGLTIGTEDKYL